MDGGFDINWAWSIGLVSFAFGAACGFALAYLTLLRNDRQRCLDLQTRLDAQRQQHDAYRSQVSQHFRTTSELVQRMTDSYREVYEHLASGSQTLCQDPVSTPQLDFPQQPMLKATATAPQAAATHASDSEFVDAETDPLQETDEDTCMGDTPHVPSLQTETAINPRTPPV